MFFGFSHFLRGWKAKKSTLNGLILVREQRTTHEAKQVSLATRTVACYLPVDV